MIDGVWWDTNSVSWVKVRCDPPLNLDLHPSWRFLASESILQLIVCSSHLKECRWLWVAGTSSPYPKGHTSCIWMGIHGRTICEQLWREEGGCYCFYSDTQLSDGVLLRNGGQSLAWSQQSAAWKTRETESGLYLLLSPKRYKATEHSRASTGTCVSAHRSYTVRGKNQ